MIRLRSSSIFFATILVFWAASAVNAQDIRQPAAPPPDTMPAPIMDIPAFQPTAEDSAAVDLRRWTFNPYAGLLIIDDGELDEVGMEVDETIILGGRIGYRLNDRWVLEGSYGLAPLSSTVEGFGDVDGTLHSYYATLNFLIPGMGMRPVIKYRAPDQMIATEDQPEVMPADSTFEVPTLQFMLSAGAGGVYYAYDDLTRQGVEFLDTSWANEFVVPVGAGISFNAGTRATLRIDAKGHFQFCEEEDEPIIETRDFSHCPLESKMLFTPELSGGFLIRF